MADERVVMIVCRGKSREEGASLAISGHGPDRGEVVLAKADPKDDLQRWRRVEAPFRDAQGRPGYALVSVTGRGCIGRISELKHGGLRLWHPEEYKRNALCAWFDDATTGEYNRISSAADRDEKIGASEPPIVGEQLRTLPLLDGYDGQLWQEYAAEYDAAAGADEA